MFFFVLKELDLMFFKEESILVNIVVNRLIVVLFIVNLYDFIIKIYIYLIFVVNIFLWKLVV